MVSFGIAALDQWWLFSGKYRPKIHWEFESSNFNTSEQSKLSHCLTIPGQFCNTSPAMYTVCCFYLAVFKRWTEFFTGSSCLNNSLKYLSIAISSIKH